MYCPRHFAQTDRAAMLALMRDHPLATLITSGDAGPDANPVPLLWCDDGSPNGVLRGHLARANPAWPGLAADSPVLALFHGPDAYVSPSWYPSKREHGRVVPTWNYALVQVRGRIRVHQQADWLHQLLDQLTTTFESARAAPWSMADAPADYLDGMLKAVVGIEIAIDDCSGKWKLSQNQPEANRAGVIAGLAEQKNQDALLQLMRTGDAG